ncbi:UDP-glucose 4-epimerase GalE [Aeromicrobium camelliae]|uniref:UDP-glucose 4-epimerase n=1 Tax=Aeromicrobium camelliae TaxID=1538144 RepID=A0A3N6Z7I5_9ACTN|nr:UDP-glucose 4-epimerase GalE [Aeromicrobium camelliae]RQN02907.1 UDP-glucose 4-epimerase GalE [Aeromicrobium camelliae]
MAILVTGGAGYIGSHIVRAFRLAGLDPVVVDDLSSGHREFVPDDVPLIELNIVRTKKLTEALRDHSIEAVVHLAGFKYAGVSVQRPLHTYQQNVQGTVSLLRAMAEHDIDKIVFSSSAAVYGTPDVDLVTERTATHPESPYGESKLVGEWVIAAQGRATGLRHTSLRYFNVVGSATDELYDSSPHNLFPLVIRALTEGHRPKIFGDDYPTPDGTCVRDYVHVADLADAHVVATQKLLAGQELEPVYNLGSGDGVSVRQIMTAVARATGIDFEPVVAPRRPGDPARIVASGQLAARDLSWTMRHTLDEMVESAWNARHQS